MSFSSSFHLKYSENWFVLISCVKCCIHLYCMALFAFTEEWAKHPSNDYNYTIYIDYYKIFSQLTDLNHNRYRIKEFY